jgi:hypothetical protein
MIGSFLLDLEIFKKGSMNIPLIVIIAIAVIIIVKFAFGAMVEKKTEKLKGHIGSLENFSADYSIIDCHGENALALDKSGKLLFVEAPGHEDPSDSIVNFENVIAVEILNDNQVVTKNSLEGAVVGGVLAGGIGALIGSQSSKSNIKKISSITIKINTNSIDRPFFKLDLFFSVKADGEDIFVESVQDALSRAEKWEGMLKAVLDQNRQSLS